MPMTDTPCFDALHQALAYMRRQTVAYTASWTPLVSSPAYREAERAVDAAVLADDLPTTKVACRTLWTLVIDFAKKGG